MKILQIINSLGTGGAEKLLLDTLPLYREEGIEMDILLLWDNDCMFTQQLQKLNCCKVYILNKSYNTRAIYNPFLILKISKIIKDYDLVHVHLFPAQYFVALANMLNGNKNKLLFTEHSTSNSRMASPFLAILDRFFYKSYSKIVAISEGVKDSLGKHLKKQSKIELIVNGVETAKVSQAPLNVEIKNRFPDRETELIVQVGGFRIQKDQDTVIRSLVSLPINYHLLLVGDGERKDQLVDLVKQLSLVDRVHFLGIRNDVFSILKSVDIVVVSSHWEGFGLAAVEGMAARKPVVASDVPGLSEVVQGAGILFPVGNSEQLAAEITALLENQEHYQSVAEACQQRAADYDIHKMVDQHIKLYKSVLET
jgi:glycosyltransferase involved in cell wall biosynthesis